MTAGVLIGGDDFKSGQTKMKSVLVDFLVGAGIKPTSIVSYNHLGNNDGMNLSAPQTFRSKEISKSNVVSGLVIAALTSPQQWTVTSAAKPYRVLERAVQCNGRAGWCWQFSRSHVC